MRRFGVAVVLGVALLAGGLAWLKAEHRPDDAIRTAQEFLGDIAAQHFAQAHELTTKSAAIGETPEAFRAVGLHGLCGTDHFAWSAPFQSNGNRLRRGLTGRAIESPELRLEFEGHACLLSVFMRHTGTGEWRVARLASHAG